MTLTDVVIVVNTKVSTTYIYNCSVETQASTAHTAGPPLAYVDSPFVTLRAALKCVSSSKNNTCVN